MEEGKTDKERRDSDYYYHGCQVCYGFSMLFGGCERDGRWINSEEEFELIKAEYVQHFNEKHRDIKPKLKDKGEIYKKYDPTGEIYPNCQVVELVDEDEPNYITRRGTITEEMVDNEQ